MKYIILLLFSLFIAPISMAEISNDSIKIEDLRKDLESLKAENESLKDEILVFKTSFEGIKTFNNDVIDSYEWAVGFAFTIIIAVIALQIFQTFRINNTKIKEIKDDIDKQFLLLETSLTNLIETNNNNSVEKLKEEVNKRFESVSKLNEKDFVLQNKEIESIENKLKTNLERLKSDVRKSEGEIYKIKNDNSGALRSFLESAVLKVKNKEYTAGIIKEIHNLLENVTELYFPDHDKLSELISIFPEDSKSLKPSFIEIKNKIKKYRLIENKGMTNPLLKYSRQYF